jgi:8-oxo-dGTP pyrophosphatase MutT (NUDIX family)
MAHLTEAVYRPVEALLGRPTVHTWTYPITEPELRMVVASTRGQSRLHDVTFFIHNGAGEYALIRKHNYPAGAWRAPGGGIHPGESMLDGAAREALEETGLTVAWERYLLRVQVAFTWGEEMQPWATHVLVGRASGGALRTRDPKEIDGTRWGRLDELCGPIAGVMLGTGRGLFAYRVALHREVQQLLTAVSG